LQNLRTSPAIIDPAQHERYYFILAPWEYPQAYAAFALHWISSLICIAVGLYFWRRKRGPWWAVIALAFALPLLGTLGQGLWHGLPPLPADTGNLLPQPDMFRQGGFSNTRQVSVYINWNFVSPLVALALAWAYFAERKKPRVTPIPAPGPPAD
jgi:hypothetical protein